MVILGLEGVVIIAKAPLTAIQFNALAIITLLAFMPFAIAIITNAGSNSDGNYQNSISMDDPNNSWRGQWIDNGINLTQFYENQYPMPAGWYGCAYISNGDCMTYNGNYDSTVPISSAKSDWNLPSPSITVPQSHQSVLAPGEYIGTSGPGPFSWLFYGETFDGIEQNSSIDSIKYSFVDSFTSYLCTYVGFTDLKIDADLTFIQGNKTKSFKGFEMSVSNKYEYDLYDNLQGTWSPACVNGIVLEFDFSGFESLALEEWNDGDWASTDHLIEIKNVERKDGQPISNTALPWAGDGYFRFTAEHQPIDSVQAGFIIKSLTVVLSVGTFALAIASTPYWDPFKSAFKGVA